MRTLIQSGCASAAALAMLIAGSSMVRAGEAPDPGGVDARIQQLERRIQMLEQAMTEKDARIGELQNRLREAPAPEREPGFSLQIGPEEMRRFQERLEEHLRKNLDEPFFNQPFDGDPGELDNVFPFQRGPGGPGGPGGLSKPRLGVSLSDSTDELRERFHTTAKDGAFVVEVSPKSAAEQAGLMSGDVVTAFDGLPIAQAPDLIEAVQKATAGVHKLVLKRHGEELSVSVNLPKKEAGSPLWDDGMRREGRWLRKGLGPQEPGNRKEKIELRVSSLELQGELNTLLKLDEKQRAKMDEVLADERNALTAEYTEREKGGRERGPLARGKDQDLKNLIEKHVQAAEEKLKDVLSADQLKSWREYRETHHTVSISRELEMEGGGKGEAMGF